MASETGPHSSGSRLPAAALSMVMLAAGLLVACEDPLKERGVEALGPEALNVPEGPLHRPGQPCVLCHDGETARAFSLGGTVYVSPDSDRPAGGASVGLVDASGAGFVAITNCAGNFFVLPEDFQPAYPLWAAIRSGTHEIVMDSPIHEDGSCAGCHGMEAGPESAGRVYVFPIAPEPPVGECP